MNRYLIISACCFFLSGRTLAQNKADTLVMGSIQEAISLAVKHNPSQAIYQQQILQAKYTYKSVKGGFYPSASASISGQDNLHLAVTPVPGELIGKPGTTYDLQFGKKYNYNTGINLGENIFNWQLLMQTEIAKNNVKLSELQQDAYVQSLKEQVARLYYTTLISKASLKTNVKDQLLADSLVILSKQRLHAGTTDEIAVNQAMINFNNVKQNRAQSQQLYDQGIENLKIILGTKAEDGVVFEEFIQLDSLSKQNNNWLGNDKNLSVYEQQEEVAILQSKSQRSVAYPTLSASAFLGAQQYRNDFGLSLSSNAWSANRYIGLNLNIPLFTGLTNSNKYKSAVVQQNIAALQYTNAKLQSSINDQLLLKNNENYLNMVKAAQRSYILYYNSLMLNRQKFTEGIITMDVYLKAFQDYLTAENNYLNNLSQLFSIRATILSRQ
ncbi:TolC family protein [Pedobacter sp. L105]|uniref:TolC family protein n=1 Tax=Pedobacter sp. L105 TaxID=1641871 RepID=UPI00131DFC77|nr:TolC family protein [Pedobacter sp. L105]